MVKWYLSLNGGIFIVLCFIFFLPPLTYRGGTPESSFEDYNNVIIISVSEAKELIENTTDLFILDVRTNTEFKTGHIPNAHNIPVDLISTSEAELPQNKSQPILIYCKAGGRSATASSTISSLGYVNIYDMTEGFDAWKDAGYQYDIEPSSNSSTSYNISIELLILACGWVVLKQNVFPPKLRMLKKEKGLDMKSDPSGTQSN